MFNSLLLLRAAALAQRRSAAPPHTPRNRPQPETQARDGGHTFAVPTVREVRTAPPVDERGLW